MRHPVRILILHGLTKDSRQTNIDHTLSFWRYSKADEIYYVNVLGFCARAVELAPFDLLIVTYEVLGLRNSHIWKSVEVNIKKLASVSKKTIFFPQDDYSSFKILDSAVVEIGVEAVYSPITKDVRRLYPKSIISGVRLEEALTGYVETSSLLEKEKYCREFHNRGIDLGQRVSALSVSFGAVATRKSEIAIRFAQLAEQAGFITDVSTNPNEVFVGESWWNFLGNVKFTISRKGGASLGDPLGKIVHNLARIQMVYPPANEALLQKVVKLSKSVAGDFSAVSPRLFEASALGVCQILEVDDYLGLLVPWIDYLPLMSDFSNVNEILDTMRNLDFCKNVASSSKNKLIKSNEFTYEKFINDFEKREIGLEDRSINSSKRIDLDYMFSDHRLYDEITELINSGIVVLKQFKSMKNVFFPLRSKDTHNQLLEGYFRKQVLLESFTTPWVSVIELVSAE